LPVVLTLSIPPGAPEPPGTILRAPRAAGNPLSAGARDVEAQAQAFRGAFGRLAAELGKVVVGHAEVVEQTLVALFAGGHVLLEGVPGLGKTLLVRTLVEALDLRFSRIQFTPDLMPADILGTTVLAEADGRRAFEFRPGPIFANVVLADEINRATPKTQSALLEAMQEERVTAGGATHALEAPFFVLATQNPLEMEGTFPLPEAQLDRFLFKVDVRAPARAELVEVLARTTGAAPPPVARVAGAAQVLGLRAFAREVPVARVVLDQVAALILATHPDGKESAPLARRFVRYGASPRGGQALVLGAKVLALARGRLNVALADVAALARPALRHRLILSFEGEAEGIRPDAIVEDALTAAGFGPA
jgi:MoxR-like ATPase